jgi:hypothetical protein
MRTGSFIRLIQLRRLAAFAVPACALLGCSGGSPGAPGNGSGNPDAPSAPAPPALGPQLARYGRPLIPTALIGVFAADQTRDSEQAIYQHAADPASWPTTTLDTNVTIASELEANLAVFDAIDKGLVVQSHALTGCGDALAYLPPASRTAYQSAASLFADDELYVDTARTTCDVYLALEIEQTTGGTFVHTTCGGRTPSDDVIDMTYSVLASGTDALDPANLFRGKISDGVGPHVDLTTAFPFLGPPH